MPTDVWTSRSDDVDACFSGKILVHFHGLNGFMFRIGHDFAVKTRRLTTYLITPRMQILPLPYRAYFHRRS